MRQTSEQASGGADGSMRRIWFLNTLVQVHVAASDGSDGLSVLEHRAPFADSPPLHVHDTEDEIFHILEGDFRVQVANDVGRYGAGTVVLGPKGVPHTYRVESSAGGRFVTVTAMGSSNASCALWGGKPNATSCRPRPAHHPPRRCGSFRP